MELKKKETREKEKKKGAPKRRMDWKRKKDENPVAHTLMLNKMKTYKPCEIFPWKIMG